MNFDDLEVGREYEIRLTGTGWDEEQGQIRTAVYKSDNMFNFMWKNESLPWSVDDAGYSIEVTGEYATPEEYSSSEFINSRPSEPAPTPCTEGYAHPELQKVKEYIDFLIHLESNTTP